MSFIHLHNHTEYSLLDGAMQIDRLTELAARYRMPSLAITDHGNMFGAIEFYKSAQKRGIKPIIGMETYVAPGSRKDQARDTQVPESSFHLTLLCENETGYHNLIRLSSHAFLDGFYYKPRIDKELLRTHSAGLIALSGCLKGEIPYRIARGDQAGAEVALAQYQEIFGKDRFYLEIMRLGTRAEERVNAALLDLSNRFDAPLVATNDCHYFSPDDQKAHDVLLCIGTKKTLQDKERLKFETHLAYFRSPEEMAALFEDLPEAITNTMLIGERCNLKIDISGKDVKLPGFPRPPEFNSDFDYLKHLAGEGIVRRYAQITAVIRERLDHELTIIRKMGLSGYFLIVRDIIQYAHEHQIPVGPGRGSAVGSVVLYSLNITDVDPLKYDLLFERFLNPERISMPDVDVDFGDTRRDEVIDFIRRRYGDQNVTQVMTFGTMQARAVVRDVARVMSIPYGEVDRLAKLIPFGQTIDEALKGEREFRTLIESNEQYRELVDVARRLEGLARHPATHAAGVVITPRELLEYVPLYKSPDRGEVSTQYAKNSLEDIGLLKMDILGLRTLTVIKDCLDMTGIAKEQMPDNDAQTFEMLKRGETIGVFQLESKGMQDLLKAIAPERFEELIAIIALYRPGPMGSFDPALIVRNKKHPESIKYPHPAMASILSETYGIMVYQEQVMQIAAKLAGFTLAEADSLRRAMAKKIPELMDENREKFIAGAKKNGISEDHAEKIFNSIAPFAGYGFNKSHAAAYAVLAFQTAYLKSHYPQEFMVACLNSEVDDTKRLWVLIREARRMNIAVLPPDINASDYWFSKEGANIRYGLGAVKNLGRPVVDAIVKERLRGPFKSFFDFQTRMKVTNRKAIESLIKAGAFMALEKNQDRLLAMLADNGTRGSQTSLFGTEEPDPTQGNGSSQPFNRGSMEKEAFGFFFSEHPLERYQLEYGALGLVSLGQIGEIVDDRDLAIGAIINAKKVKKDKNGRNYAILNVEDFESAIDVFVFSETFERFSPLLKVDTPLIIKGRLSGEEEKRSIRAEIIVPFDQAHAFYDRIVIECTQQESEQPKLQALRRLAHENKGQCEIWFKIEDNNVCRRFRSRTMKIKPAPDVLMQLQDIFGCDHMHVFGKI